MLILKRHVSKAVVACCLLVACGFFLGIDQEKALGSLSVKGVVFGVLSSIFIALTGIYTKTALDVVNKDEVWISRFLHHVSKTGPHNSYRLFCQIETIFKNSFTTKKCKICDIFEVWWEIYVFLLEIKNRLLQH